MKSGDQDRIELSDHTDAALANPSAYEGVVVCRELGDVPVTVKKAAEKIECGPILERQGRWAITEFGIECLSVYYPIFRDRIRETDWVKHISEKSWVTEDDKADLSEMLRRAKVKWPE